MEEVRKSIWQGAIPVVFTLTSNEVTALQPPEPYYLMAPRGSYLPVVAEPVRDYLLQAAPARIDEMWFEFKGQPIKWHYPIGVLFDLLTASQLELPWGLTVHFQSFPSDKLMRCSSQEVVKSHYMNVLKEATHLKLGDSNKVNNLPLSEQNDLWAGIVNLNFSQFWSINNKLQTEPLAMKYIPLRICIMGQPTIQEPVQDIEVEGHPRTLLSVLQELLPGLFPVASGEGEVVTNNNLVLVQGIEPPLDTPISWLYQQFSHPDNFLYVVIHPS